MAHNPNNTDNSTTGQARPPKPSALPVQADAIPSVLQERTQWVFWRWTWSQKTQRWEKFPFQSHGGNLADSSKPSTWSGFQAALNAYHAEESNADGIGYMFHKKSEVGGDLDHCRDPKTGTIEPWAQTILDEVNTYSEVSTSGRGVHFVAEGSLPGRGLHVGHIELYDTGRYFCTTGQHLPGTPLTVEPRQEYVTQLYQRLREQQAGGKKRMEPSNNGTGPSPHLDDDMIIQKALGARNGQKFATLWRGDVAQWAADRLARVPDDEKPRIDISHSAADLALCREFVHWTEDREQIDRLFRRSKLMRDKWDDHPTYADDTITKAIDTPHDRYQGVSEENNGQPQDERNASANSDIGETPNDQKVSVRLPRSDHTNAVALVKARGQDLHYCHPAKLWYAWDGRRWLADETAAVMRWATDIVKAMATHVQDLDTEQAKTLLAHIKSSLSTSRLKAMVEQTSWLPAIPVLPKELDQDPWLLNCPNGTLDLRTGELLRHRREDLITMMTAAEYHPDARSQIWERSLLRILPDENDRRYVQKAAGYSLTGLGTEDVLFFPFGPTKTGKSTLLKALRATWGDYATTADFETFLTREHVTGAPRADIAGLAGKRLVVSLEVDQGKKLAEALIKWLFGGDYVTARFLYKKEFEFLPTFKLWLASNHRPQVSSDDDAIWERIRQIPFEQTIPKEDRDPGIKAELSNPEQSGAAILAWAVEGCLLWQQEGLGVPKHVEDTTEAYRKEMDPMPDFIEACLVKDDNGRVLNAAMWECYQTWSRKNRDRPKLGRKTFTQRLEQADVDSIESGGYRFWLGVRLRYHTTSDQGDSEKASDEL